MMMASLSLSLNYYNVSSSRRVVKNQINRNSIRIENWNEMLFIGM
jgi:hypothetical protein